jgi:ankyrin repeat protein
MVVKLLGMYGSEMTTKAHTRHGLFTNATALDRAAKYGHKEVVRLLAPIPLPAISIPNRVAIASFLPLNLPPVLSGFETRRQYLSLALMESAKAGNIEICEYLISEGADVNFLEEICIAPPLYFAVQADNLAVVQLLLAAGAQPNLHNECIPLFGALRTRNFDVVQALVDGGADIHVRGNQSQNVLSTCPTLELLRFFLERGVNPNSEDTAGETPLHRACRRKNAEFAKASVELFLQFGATVETVSLATRTPVHVAMEARHPEIVKILQPLVQGPDLKLEIEDWWNLWEQTHQSY